jgi:hypothetical protein
VTLSLSQPHSRIEKLDGNFHGLVFPNTSILDEYDLHFLRSFSSKSMVECYALHVIGLVTAETGQSGHAGPII